MKHLILILFACIANISLVSFHGSHHSSHSSHHSSSHSYHHSSGHTSSHSYHISHGTSGYHSSNHSTSHPYTHVTHIPNSYIHSTRRNNHLMYYYLLHNNHTNTHDTIYAGSQEELQAAVDEVSEEPATMSGGVLFVILAVVAFIVCFALFFKH